MRKLFIVGLMLTVGVLVGVGVIVVDPASSQPASHGNWEERGQGHGNRGCGAEEAEEHNNRGQGHYKEREEGRRVRLSTHDKWVIRDYFLPNTSNPPPGLAKRGGELPPLPNGYSRVILGTHVLILNSANIIMGIMAVAR